MVVKGVKGPVSFLKNKTFCLGACSEWVLNHNWALIRKYKNKKQQKLTEKEIFYKKKFFFSKISFKIDHKMFLMLLLKLALSSNWVLQ